MYTLLYLHFFFFFFWALGFLVVFEDLNIKYIDIRYYVLDQNIVIFQAHFHFIRFLFNIHQKLKMEIL